jgi:tetratricopeptide (TPR) repeat protein
VTKSGRQTDQGDVLVSFAPADAELAGTLQEELRRAGVRALCIEHVDADPRLPEGVASLVAKAKVVIVLYSETYHHHRICQSALTSTFIAARQEGDPRDRLVIINQEKEADHILPEELREGCLPKITGRSTNRLKGVVSKVRGRLEKLAGPIGRSAYLTPPPWHGMPLIGYPHFVDRYKLMWRLHRSLHPGVGIPQDNSHVKLVLVHGGHGAGKSALAEEYAYAFGCDYPGGVFWLRAYGTEDHESGMGPEEREAERDRQIRAFAAELGVIIANRGPEDIRDALGEALGKRKRACLWIVDDLPPGLEPSAVQDWVGPHHLARTLITTPTHEYNGLGVPIEAAALDPGPAFDLLTSQRTPATTEEEESARRIASRLGGHPLGLSLAAGLVASRGDRAFADLERQFDEPSEEKARLAESLAGEIRSGTEAAVASALLEAVRQLDEEGRDFLRLASSVAAAPVTAALYSSALIRTREDPNVAAERADRDVTACHDRRLTEKPSGAQVAPSVHPLVSRTVRMTDPRPIRLYHLRAAAVAALLEHLPQRYDPGTYASLDFEITHARELTRRATTVAESELLARVARYDLVRGAYASGRILYERQRRISHDLFGEKHSTTAEAISNLAGAHFIMGDFDGALEMHLEALTLRQIALGLDHPDTVVSMNNLAATYQARGEMDDAEFLQDEMLQIRRRLHGERHPKTTKAAWNLYLTLSRMGKEDAAHEVLANHLYWLKDAEPTAIATDQRRIRELVSRVQ